MPLFLTRAASSFGFADLYSQDPGLQLERYPESFVSVYLLLVVYCIIFRCYVFKCNLNLWYFCVIFIYTLYILVFWCIVVIYNEMFFCMCSVVVCSRTIRRFPLRGSYGFSQLVSELWFTKLREQDTLEPYERIHQILD